MEKTLLRFVWVHSRPDQILIVLASLVSFPLILASLYVPKIIVNDALRGTEFPQTFLWLRLEQIEFLLALCGSLLLLILLNNAVKYYINIQKGLTGERLLRRVRFTVFERVTRMPLSRLRATSPGEVVQVLAAEVEPIGGFSGAVIATPVYQGGQLLVYVGFIIAQDPVLGLAAIILFPVQAYVIPKIQRVVIGLNRSRIRNTREMTSEISETVQGAEAMRLSGARAWHLARMSDRLYTNFRIRYRIFVLKFAIKFANNVINHITPFFFYGFGGYLVIEGRMDLGALVAILAAYKDIAAPWRELLTYYQSYSDISTRYEAVVESYGADRIADLPQPLTLRGETIVLERVTSDVPRDSGGVEGVSLALRPGSRVLIAGAEDGGRAILMRLLAGAVDVAAGEVRVGGETGRDLLTRGSAEIAFVSRTPHILTGTIRENVAYSLLGTEPNGAPPPDHAAREREARITGAPPEDPHLDWVDYPRIGIEGPEAFDHRVIEVMEAVGLLREVFARGLSTRIDTAANPEIARAALDARAVVREERAAMGLDDMVEHWAPDGYLENASVAENLFFGVPDKPLARNPGLAGLPQVRRALAQAGIEMELAEIGLETAETLQDLLGALGRDTTLIDQLGLVQQAEMEEFARIIPIARRRGVRRLGRADRERLVALAFQLVPLRHRLGVLDAPERRARLIAARARLAGTALPAFTRFDSDGYIPGLPVIENILQGRPRLDRRDAIPPIEARLEEAMRAHDLHDFVIAAGLRTDVGLSGSTLSPSQKRRLALARAITASPALLLLDGVADETGEAHVTLRTAIARLLPEATVVFGSMNEALVPEMDDVIRIANGRVAETAGSDPDASASPGPDTEASPDPEPDAAPEPRSATA